MSKTLKWLVVSALTAFSFGGFVLEVAAMFVLLGTMIAFEWPGGDVFPKFFGIALICLPFQVACIPVSMWLADKWDYSINMKFEVGSGDVE